MSAPAFSQPTADPEEWTAGSGLPYPGAEGAAEQIKADEKAKRLTALAEHEAEKALARKQGQAKADEDEGGLRKVLTRRADSIQVRRTRWLWAPGSEGHGRIPLGELTLIVGRGGVGKSTLLAEFIAWITTGNMQGEFWEEPRDAIYVANEDSLERTVVPRLIAAGADLARVHFLTMSYAGQEARVMLPTDCEAIGELARTTGAATVMLDPLSSNLRVDNANDAKQMRTVIETVRKMCEKYDISAVGLAHTRKQDSKNLMDAIMGSSELGNVCRSAMGVMADPEEEGTVVLSQEKSNMGRMDIPSYKYKIEDHSFFAGEVISTSRLKFLGKTDQRVSEMLAESMSNIGGSPEGKECEAWLVEFLQFHATSNLQRPNVPATVPRTVVMAAGKKEGYPEHTVKRAAKRKKVRFLREGFPSTSAWALPE